MEWSKSNSAQMSAAGGGNTAATLQGFSFIPEELGVNNVAPAGGREVCAYVGLVASLVSLVSWVIILLGIVFSVIGIGMSFIGLKSGRKKYAKAGMIISALGLIASLGYAFAIHEGKVNYDYFTSEIWSSSSTSQAK